MSWILDVIIVLIIGLTVFFAAKNGFAKTLISTASFAICLIVTVIFVSPLSGAIQQTPVADDIRNTTRDNINGYITGSSLGGIENLLDGESSEFNTLIGVAGLDRAELKEWYAQNVGAGDDAGYKLAAKISEPIIRIISSIIAVVVLFLGTKLLLVILSLILKQIVKLPVLKKFDRGLGVVLGILLALIRVCLFCFIFKVITQNSMFLSWEVFRSLSVEKTLLFRLFYDFDLFGFIKSLF